MICGEKMSKSIISLFIFLTTLWNTYSQPFYNNYINLKSKYIQLSGSLFKDAQLSGVFSDSKTFVDAIPIGEPAYILKLYDSIKTQPDFNLNQFIFAHFQIPNGKMDTIDFSKKLKMAEHISELWMHLIRNPLPENKYSTLLPLKEQYVVPGGRFREIYYWDSFFTLLGLLADKKVKEAENMANNFAFLLDKYKMIPNGNRVYYLTRSQPPFFSLMVDIICRYKNDYTWGLQFLKQLQIEYSFWMDGSEKLNNNRKAIGHVVYINENEILNRYYDYDTIPREESFKEDYNLSLKITDSLRSEFCRNLRAAAESGWDFSSRWFKDEKTLQTIHTTDILPVDLNCLLYFLEDRLSFFYKLNNDLKNSTYYKGMALKRLKLINRIFWDEKKGYYFDYDWKTKHKTSIYSLAGCYPLYFGIAKPEYAAKVRKELEKNFLKPGGLVTTFTNTGQQWDSPNGWPPLQWIAIKALREYGFNTLADTIKLRWLHLNETIYNRTGKMLEKYNVENLSLFGGGGEYPLQDGFGWTNGVAASLINNFEKIYLIRKAAPGSKINNH